MTITQNYNLIIAEELLDIISKKPDLVRKTFNDREILTFELEDESLAPEVLIGNYQIVRSLKRLEDRGIVRFEDEEDKWDTDDLKYINLYFNKDALDKFVKVSKDRFYGLLEEYKKKEELNYVLEALASILRFKSPKKTVDFSEIDNKYIDVCEWIADHSGALEIIYEDEPDVEWKDLKRPRILGISETPRKFIVIDAPVIEKLEDDIQQLVIMPQIKRVELFLKNNAGMDWRCAKCKHFLQEKLSEEKQITNYLNDFNVRKFRVCYKCRKRNYFSISPKGEIKFSITKSRMLGEKKTKEDMAKEINISLRKIKKAGILPKAIE